MASEIITNKDRDFAEVLQMIATAKSKVWHEVNKVLIELYWAVGRYVSVKSQQEGWGKRTVEELSIFVNAHDPSMRGFSARNIWRMKKFYETYVGQEKLSAVLTEITWTNHLHVLSKTKTIEEKEFYLRIVAKNIIIQSENSLD